MQDQDDRETEMERLVEEPIERVLEPPVDNETLMDQSIANAGGDGPLEGVGVYDRPNRPNLSLGLVILLIVAAIVAAVLLLR